MSATSATRAALALGIALFGFALPLAAAAAAAEGAPPPGRAGYDRGFYIRTEDGAFSLSAGARLQARYAYEVREGAADRNAFSIARARLKLSGTAFTKDLAWLFQADFGKGFVTLKDFYADYAFLPGLRLRAGQWKRPLSRQQIASTGHLELVDRALTDGFFGNGRDIGLALHDDYERSPGFEWVVGLFNGSGDKPHLDGTVDLTEGTIDSGAAFGNVPKKLHPLVLARVGFNYGGGNGIRGFTEADLEGGPLRFAVGLGGQADFDVDGGDDAGVTGVLDFILKVQGFALSGAVFAAAAQEGGALSDLGFSALGLHAQAGYVFAGLVQPAVRYTWLAPDGSDNDVHEAALALSFYLWGHNVKWQSDVAWLRSEQPGGSQDDWVVRSQLQLAF